MLKVVLHLVFHRNRQDDTNLELCLESRKKENREYLEKR
jgi:hypothetical protein